MSLSLKSIVTYDRSVLPVVANLSFIRNTKKSLSLWKLSTCVRSSTTSDFTRRPLSIAIGRTSEPRGVHSFYSLLSSVKDFCF